MCIAMCQVGTTIQSKYHWVPLKIILYLVLDNTGGHGTDDCITRYVALLKSDFSIEFIHQVPRSPFTNILDLGIWAMLQSEVEIR